MKKLYGFGYQGKNLMDLKAQLEDIDATLIDVRYRPFSKNPTWRKVNLQKSLGARYKHVEALGNVNYKGGGILLADEERGIQAVLAELQSRSVVLMCVCPDAFTCHRALIADLLEARGVQVEELCPEPQTSLDLW